MLFGSLYGTWTIDSKVGPERGGKWGFCWMRKQCCRISNILTESESNFEPIFESWKLWISCSKVMELESKGVDFGDFGKKFIECQKNSFIWMLFSLYGIRIKIRFFCIRLSLKGMGHFIMMSPLCGGFLTTFLSTSKKDPINWYHTLFNDDSRYS